MKRRKDEQGAAAIEFALVMPILFLVVFGIIAYGVWFAQDLALSNSARQAARYGVVDNRTCADMITEARSSASTLAMDGNSPAMTVTVTVTHADGSTTSPCSSGTVQPCKGSKLGDNVNVSMVYPVEKIVPLVPVPDQVDGKGVFRCEFS
jgi:Flp pilus assembly protein TadG